MSKYKLIADFDCSSIEQIDENDVICVRVPFLPGGEPIRGIQSVVSTLKKNCIFPSEIGFDILTLATMVYLADTRISRQTHGQDSWSREIQLEVSVSDSILWNEQARLIKGKTLKEEHKEKISAGLKAYYSEHDVWNKGCHNCGENMESEE